MSQGGLFGVKQRNLRVARSNSSKEARTRAVDLASIAGVNDTLSLLLLSIRDFPNFPIVINNLTAIGIIIYVYE